MNRLHGLHVSVDRMNRYGWCVCACVYACLCVCEGLKTADVNKTEQLAGEGGGGGVEGGSRKTEKCVCIRVRVHVQVTLM